MVSQEDKSLLVSGPERLLRYPTQAVIFDNDGVIVDTEKPHWWPSIRDTLTEYGVVVPESERAQFQGQHPLGNYIVRTFKLEENPDIVYEKIKQKLELSYATKGLSAMPGAVELVRHLGKRFPLSVASSSPTEHVIKVLK